MKITASRYSDFASLYLSSTRPDNTRASQAVSDVLTDMPLTQETIQSREGVTSQLLLHQSHEMAEIRWVVLITCAKSGLRKCQCIPREWFRLYVLALRKSLPS